MIYGWYSGFSPTLSFLHHFVFSVELRAATPSVGTPKPGKNEAAEDDEPSLNEDDDDDELDDLDQEEDEPNTQHLVLALFDKVFALICSPFYSSNMKRN